MFYPAIIEAVVATIAEQQFEERLRDVPPEEAAKMRRTREEERERARQERLAERRHQELVEAIRSRYRRWP